MRVFGLPKQVKTRVLSTALLSSALTALAFPPVALAQGGCVVYVDEVPQLSGLACVLVNLIASGLGVLAGVGAIFMLIGGVKYATATGDPKALESAKKTLTYAILGFIIVLGARAILTFIATILGVEGYEFWSKVFFPG